MNFPFMHIGCVDIRRLLAASVLAASAHVFAGDPVEWTYVQGLKDYQRGEYTRASTAFEQVIAKAPRTSEYHRWLGRAYGRMAESSAALVAVSPTLKTRESLERAVAEDSSNIRALEDLRSFYLLAPAILGGDSEKAAGLTRQIEGLTGVN